MNNLSYFVTNFNILSRELQNFIFKDYTESFLVMLYSNKINLQESNAFL